MKFNPLEIRPRTETGPAQGTGSNPVLSELFQKDLSGASSTGANAPAQGGPGLLTAGIVPTQNKQPVTIADAIARFNPSSAGYRDWEDNYAHTNS